MPGGPPSGRARRRFIELIDSGSSNNWDAHGDMISHAPLATQRRSPIAGLLKDLKRRGLLDETLVVWTTEFGRTPFNNSAKRARPGASPLGVLVLAGRRRRQGRHRPWRDRRAWHPRCRE